MVYFLQKSVAPVPGKSSLDAEMGGCGMLIDNLHQWMEKKVRPLKRAVVRTVEIEVVSFPPCSAFFCGVRRTRVDHDRAHHPCVVLESGTTPVSFLRVVEARVCDATEARVSVAFRVRSYSCPRHIDCNHFYQTCA